MVSCQSKMIPSKTKPSKTKSSCYKQNFLATDTLEEIHPVKFKSEPAENIWKAAINTKGG